MLLRTKTALTECHKHLESVSASGTVIESYLTQHVLVLLAADMQQAIYELLDHKAKHVDQKEIKQFISSAGKSLVRGVKKSTIAGFVKHFGGDAKRKFDDYLKDKDREITQYGNAITDRDSVAHHSGTHITFSELQQAVDAAEVILSAIKDALDLEIGSDEYDGSIDRVRMGS